jgi:PAS domain S-box-containing protein
VVNVVRLIVYFFQEIQTNDYLNSGPFETAVLMSYQVLFTFLTFSLVLMFNRRLLLMINAEEEKFKKAFHLSPYVIIISRFIDGKILEVNRGFSLLTGYSVSEVLGKSTIEMNFWVNIKDRNEVLDQLNNNGRVLQKEYQFRKKSGEIVTGVFNSAVIDINGENCTMSVIYDITERKNMEIRLVELNATKDKFLSIIAHDLKSPLNNIFGFSNLMIEGKNLGTDEMQQYASLINKSASNTIDLLENLLEWASLQDGRISFKPRLVNVNELLSEMISMIGESATEKRIDISMAETGNIKVKVDENMIKTVVRNLLSNAVKFTKPGGKIEVSAIRSENEVVVKVTDSGVGISAENINKLFDIGSGYFTRGTKNEKGTGIGLLLCHEFVEKHGGKMIVESREGEGSTFSFTIPVN